MSIVVCLIICAVNSLIVNAVSIRYVQMLQLSGYRIRGVIGWLKRTNGDYLTRTFALVFFSVATMLIFVVCFSQSIVLPDFKRVLYSVAKTTKKENSA